MKNFFNVGATVVVVFLLFSFTSAPIIFAQRFRPVEPIEPVKPPKTKPRPDLSGARPGISVSQVKPPLTLLELQSAIEKAKALAETRTKDIGQQIIEVKQYYGITENEALWSDEARQRINNLNIKRTWLMRERQLLSIYKGHSEFFAMMMDLQKGKVFVYPSQWRLVADILEARRESFLRAATELGRMTSQIGNLTDGEKLDILKNIKSVYSRFFDGQSTQNKYDTLMSRALQGDSWAMIDLRTLFIDESAREQGRLEGMNIVAQNPSKDMEVLVAEDQKRLLDKRNKTLREVLGLLYK